MIRNYLKTAFRNLKRNSSYTFINIAGLAIGIAASMLIFLVIQFEKSFDDFHSKKNNIYRIGSEFHTQDGIGHSAGIAFPVGKAIRIDYPWIKEVASIFQMDNGQVTINDEKNGTPKKFNAETVYYAEPEFFKLFNFPWLAGDPLSVLKEPNSAVVTQEIAEKYFGNWQSAIGKTIKHNNQYLYKIAGVIKNIPANSDFPLSVVVSYSTLANTQIKRNLDDWVSTFSQHYTFVELPDNYSPFKFKAELIDFAKKHKKAEDAKDAYDVQPLNDIHYNSDFGNFRNHTFSKSLITALIFIGIFLILIACVNFINLATAQAVNRSKEVGVRKVLGGNRIQLAFQFLSETALITIASILIAIVIAMAALPFINKLLQVHIAINFSDNPVLILFLITTAIAVTFLSGFYPAMILSGFNPIAALKNKISAKMVGGITLRRGLVIVQFAIAHILIIGTVVVVFQMNYFRNASLGFDKAAIINVPIPGDSISHTKIEALRNQLMHQPGIKNASFSFSSPAADGNWNSDFKFDHNPKNTNFSANLKWADAEYFKTYGIQFVAGRPYQEGDTVKEFVVNETLLKKLGITNPEDALGKEINFWDGVKVASIVGVIRDFNSYSLREPMAPVVLSTWNDVYQTINIKINPGAEKSVMAFVEKIWNQAFPDYVYEYQFLDTTIKNFYAQENQLSQLYKIFAAIAILISCLGLYGLVSFMAVQRTKEMGIRKVLGASARNIVYLLSKEFSLLIVTAFVIAGPVAYYIMHEWLQNYTYRIKLGVSVFVMAIVSSMVIAWITVGHRAIKAAIANPVKSLRTE